MKKNGLISLLLGMTLVSSFIPVSAQSNELIVTPQAVKNIEKSVVLDFDDELDTDTLSSISVVQAGAEVKADISYKNNSVTITPAYMTDDTTYTIQITPELKNFDGTKAAKKQDISFTSKEMSPKAYGVDNLNNEEGDLYVAYIGGSITLGTGEDTLVEYYDGTSGRSRWATQLTKNYFEKNYPNKTVHEVNAGIGGTGSDLGMFRIDKHIVDNTNGEGPDIVFIEFTLNNETMISNNLTQNAKQSMEEMVRQLARLPKQPAIVLVESPHIPKREAVAKESVEYTEEIAKYYGIATMDVQPAFEEVANSENKSTYFADGVHPNSKGYTIYANALINMLETDESKYLKKLTWQSEPLHDREFGNPTMIAADDERIKYTGTWTKRTDIAPGTFQEGVMETTELNASCEIEFTGTTFGILAETADGLGVIDCQIDGKPCEEWGSWVVHHRDGIKSLPQGTVLKMNLTPGKHKAVIRKIEPDNYKNGAFQFGYILLEEPLSKPLISIGDDTPSGGEEDNDKEILISSVYPKNKAENVSILEDISIVLADNSAEVTASDISVTGKNIPQYNVKIDGSEINIEFVKELPYEEEITYIIGSKSYTFNTERDPITTLFYADFNDGKIAGFENVGTNPKNISVVYDGKLLMRTAETRTNGGSGGITSTRARENDILYITGSENWTDYVLDLDLQNGYSAKSDETGEYFDCESMISVKTDKNLGKGVSLVGRFVNPGQDAFWSMYAIDNYNTTGGWHGGWNVFNSQYRTVHHMTINAIGKDVKFKFTGYGKDIENIWSNALEENSKGGVSLRSSWGWMLYDNIRATDKGLLFTPTALKNVRNELTLNFNEELNEDAVNYIKILKNGVDQNAAVTLSENKKSVYVSTAGLDSEDTYTLSVGLEVQAASGRKMSSEKKVNFTISDNFGLLRVTPGDGEENVDVFSDVIIEMSNSVSKENVENYISVYGIASDKYDVSVNSNIITLVFKEALPYDEDIKVTVKKGMKSVSGKTLENNSVQVFHTEEDKSDVLYEQNFDGLSAKSDGDANGDKFGGLTVDVVNHAKGNNSYEIIDGTLFMNLYYQCGQDNDNGHIRFLIDGSDKWSDYEISADFKQNVPDAEKWVFSGFGMRYNGTTLNNSAKVFLNYLKNAGSEPRLSFKYIDGDGKQSRLGWDTCNLETDKWYRLTASVAGQTVSGKIEKDGEKIKEATYDIGGQTGNENALNKQGYAYIAPMWYRSYVDNIKVIDKGLSFTKSTTKFTDGKIDLTFDREMNTESSPVVIFDNNKGNKITAEAAWKNNKTLSVNAQGLENGVQYTVTVKRDGIVSTDETMLACDKSFKVIADVPYFIDNVKVGTITAGQKLTATTNITDYAKKANNSYMLVLAVFDENGALYSIATDTKTNLNKNEKTSFSVETIELPEEVTGYSAECYIWDNMQGMNHIGESVIVK